MLVLVFWFWSDCFYNHPWSMQQVFAKTCTT